MPGCILYILAILVSSSPVIYLLEFFFLVSPVDYGLFIGQFAVQVTVFFAFVAL